MARNFNTLIVYDLETTGKNKDGCQITQIAAIALHSRKLTLEPNGIFNSELKPIMDDEEAIKAGFDPIEEKALEVTRKTREGLAKAPETKVVWESFVNWVNRFNWKKGSYTAPIPCGYNINGFDSFIIQRYCEKYGPLNSEGRQGLFNNIWKIDLMDMIFGWTESNEELKNRKLTTIAEWVGIPKDQIENAHDALVDIKLTANILIKLLKFQRALSKTTKFDTAFAGKELYIE